MPSITTGSRAARQADDTCPLDPPGIDPRQYPIIARHWFGIEPFCLIGEVAVEVVAELKRQRQIENVHRLGVRAVGELLHQVAEGEDLDRALDGYQRLTPDLLKAMGGDQFAPLPIHEVRR